MPTETVLITGASSGIGLELAKLFAADRSNLVLVARRGDELTRLANDLRTQHGIQAAVIARDLADPAAPPQIFAETERAGLTIDVLVNNAGFGAQGRFHEIDSQRQLDMVQVNITALMHLTRLYLPGMVARARGGVLNVASTAAFQPGPLMAVYYASKAFVLSFSEALTEELRKSGVTVSCLCPGATATGFASEARMEGSRLFKMGAMSVDEVARQGHRGFRRGKPIVITGFKNKLTPLAVRLTPRSLVRRIAKSLNK